MRIIWTSKCHKGTHKGSEDLLALIVSRILTIFLEKWSNSKFEIWMCSRLTSICWKQILNIKWNGFNLENCYVGTAIAWKGDSFLILSYACVRMKLPRVFPLKFPPWYMLYNSSCCLQTAFYLSPLIRSFTNYVHWMFVNLSNMGNKLFNI